MALLAARTAVGAAAGGVRAYALTADSAPLSEAEAVRALVRMRKPIACTPELRGDTLVLACDPDSPYVAIASARGEEDYGFLRKRFGADYQRRKMLCAGDGEYMEVTVGDMEAWHRSYVVVPGGSAADEPGSMWADHHGLTAVARERGADYITKFFPPHPNDSFVLTTAAEIGGAAVAPGVPCATCGLRPATQRISTSGREGGSVRDVCDECAAAEFLPGQLEVFRGLLAALEAADPAERAEMMEDMEEWVSGMEGLWQSLAPPDEVAAFFRRWRELRHGTDA